MEFCPVSLVRYALKTVESEMNLPTKISGKPTDLPLIFVLPDSAALRRSHRLPGLAAEGFLKLRQIDDHAIYPELFR